MRSVFLRRLVGLLALLSFVLIVPVQPSMGAAMTGCAPTSAAMAGSMHHDADKLGHEQGSVPAKAMNSSCAFTCWTVAGMPAQAAEPADHGLVVRFRVATRPWASVATAPEPFPPRAPALS